jgi:hypothetical protein
MSKVPAIDVWLDQILSSYLMQYPYSYQRFFRNEISVTKYRTEDSIITYKNKIISTFNSDTKEGVIYLVSPEITYLRRINSILRCLDFQQKQFTIKSNKYYSNNIEYPYTEYRFVIKHELEDIVF